LFGAPDLVIEILSPGTKKYDQTDKKDVYRQFGVQEYFMVEPSARKVKTYFTAWPVCRAGRNYRYTAF
jgi:Uma2 family endonuclease